LCLKKGGEFLPPQLWAPFLGPGIFNPNFGPFPPIPNLLLKKGLWEGPSQREVPLGRLGYS